MNGVFKGTRNLHITTLVIETYYRGKKMERNVRVREIIQWNLYEIYEEENY